MRTREESNAVENDVELSEKDYDQCQENVPGAYRFFAQRLRPCNVRRSPPHIAAARLTKPHIVVALTRICKPLQTRLWQPQQRLHHQPSHPKRITHLADQCGP